MIRRLLLPHRIGRIVVLALSLIAGAVVATIDAAPIWTLIVLACLAWSVLIVFVLRGEPVHQ
jgi:hypothetical protein